MTTHRIVNNFDGNNASSMVQNAMHFLRGLAPLARLVWVCDHCGMQHLCSAPAQCESCGSAHISITQGTAHEQGSRF